MPNAIKYGALGSSTDYLLGAGVAPTLKNLANNGRKIGTTAINNTGSGNRQQRIQLGLKCRAATTPSSTSPLVEVYWVPTYDGSNFQTGDDSTDPLAQSLLYVFRLAVVTTQQYLWADVPAPHCQGKILLYNKCGAAFTNADAENILSYLFYDPNEIQ